MSIITLHCAILSECSLCGITLAIRQFDQHMNTSNYWVAEGWYLQSFKMLPSRLYNNELLPCRFSRNISQRMIVFSRIKSPTRIIMKGLFFQFGLIDAAEPIAAEKLMNSKGDFKLQLQWQSSWRHYAWTALEELWNMIVSPVIWPKMWNLRCCPKSLFRKWRHQKWRYDCTFSQHMLCFQVAQPTDEGKSQASINWKASRCKMFGTLSIRKKVPIHHWEMAASAELPRLFLLSDDAIHWPGSQCYNKKVQRDFLHKDISAKIL